METTKKETKAVVTMLILTLGLLVWSVEVNGAAPMGTVFSYQGRLLDTNSPADGLYDFQFKLYDVNVGGSPLGSDVNKPDVEVIDGYFTVELDFGSSKFHGDARWLDIGVRPGILNDPNPYTPLTPRTELTPTPYALCAATVPVPLELNGSTTDTDPILEVNSVGTGPVAYFANPITDINVTIDGRYLAISAHGGVNIVNDNGNALNARSASGIISVNISAIESAIKGEHERSGNYGSLGRGYEGVYGESRYGSGVYGKSTNGKGVHGSSENGPAVYGFSTNSDGVSGMTMSETGRGVYGYCGKGSGVRGQSESGYGVYGFSGLGNGVYGQSVIGYGVFGLSDSNDGLHGTSESGNGVSGISDTGRGLYGRSTSNYGCYASSESCYGVFGRSDSNDAVFGKSTDGVGVSGTSENGDGVFGYSNNLGNGVSGWSTNGDGVAGASGGDTGRGVYGSCPEGTGVHGESSYGNGIYGTSLLGYAGKFDGKVHIDGDVVITGNLTKGSGSFTIDHPLDPKNKYLQHSFVESPDMMNVYNGNVVLDENGEASVELPGYFEALNRDFRYQLTAIGAPAPNLYIAREISDNRFKIAGGKAGMKVSWQVTGIRQDRYAQAHRIVVEQDKPTEARGYYLHPELYGFGEEKSIEAARNARVSETRQVAKTGGEL